ncbi:YjbH domain-containing protein [Crenalkalicoccus roseus]|uniref:YjbH domain-containing protein n=1 Tax=Crenalkalicoccus roseus TaxID=1485588 RepID=UPI001F031A10|nr:YjbH domain-containing protein [Crenalkalicoccus roseus]
MGAEGRRRTRRAAALALLALSGAAPGRAEEVPATGGNLGGVGLLEMRNARFRPDGTVETGLSLRHQRQFWFLNLQPLPFLEATFRIADRLDGTTGRGRATDRALDLKLRLIAESDWRPAVAVGLQDLIGTGLYGGEYLVASKRFGPLDLTLGLGWGRLGTGAELPNPLAEVADRFGQRPRRVGQGGVPGWEGWFRGGRVAPFGGVEWSLPPLPTPFGPAEGLRAKLEWSADALRDERGGWPARSEGLRGRARSRLNLGLQWQPNPWLDAGLSFVHGTDVLARLSLRLDPARPPELASRRPPPPLAGRPAAPGSREALFAALRAVGFTPLAYEARGAEAVLAVEGGRHATLAQTAGRVMRAAQPHLPPEVEALHLDWRRQGVTVARLVLLREAVERAALGQGSAEEVLAAARLLPAAPALAGGAPTLSWGVEPRVALVLGDPRRAALWQIGVGAGARIGLGAGLAVAGSVAQPLAGNLDRGAPSDSVLPRVRSDYARYAAAEGPTIPALYAERLWNPAPDVFARVTAGLLEPMFAGISGEVLWRPFDRPWALGLDLNWVVQREYAQRLGLRDYTVPTGHLSLYADLPLWNLYGVVRAGRYLAGDWGGTLELGRRFASGIEVGGFATLTDVPFRRFGEGSFDKGLYVRIPLELLGPASASRASLLIRPVLRDGGQRLSVDNPLWEVVREGRQEALTRGFMGFVR